METPKIFESEYRFCQILWEQEPVKSTVLARFCQQEDTTPAIPATAG